MGILTSGELALYGLYDIDGVLRVTATDQEACIAYAELLEIASDEYSLINMPGSNQLELKTKRDMNLRRRAMNSN